jgi:XRE family transcriptional regulator, master regulator for biofilm formation
MIGRTIKDLRIKEGLTLSELAEKANISKSYLSNIERDLNNNPSIFIINKLAGVLEIELKTLIKSDINVVEQKLIEQEWIDFVNELKKAGVEKESIHQYKTLIDYIRWRNEYIGEKS